MPWLLFTHQVEAVWPLPVVPSGELEQSLRVMIVRSTSRQEKTFVYEAAVPMILLSDTRQPRAPLSRTGAVTVADIRLSFTVRDSTRLAGFADVSPSWTQWFAVFRTLNISLF